jgi:outer membrane murein-binding lipoprotein Lpp
MHDTIHDMTDRYRDRRMHARVNNLDRQNTRLRDEVAHLRSDLDDERTQREDLKAALRDKPTVVKKKGGLLRLLIVGGVAYLMGTRDGRERYNQIVTWARSVRAKIERNADDVAAEVVAAADV